MKQLPFYIVKTNLNEPLPESLKKNLSAEIEDDEELSQWLASLTEIIANDDIDKAFEFSTKMVEAIESSAAFFKPELGAQCYHIAAWLAINKSAHSSAMNLAVKSLQRLSYVKPKSRATLFLAACVLNDYAIACNNINSISKSEKSFRYAARILRSLALKDNKYFEAGTIVATNELLTFRSQLKKINALDQHQIVMKQVETLTEPVKDAIVEMIEVICNDAEECVTAEKYRMAVRYYTKALRYNRKITDKFDDRSFEISMKLTEALLYLPTRRETANNFIMQLRKWAEANNKQEERIMVDKLEEKAQIIGFNLLSFLKNLIY